MSSTNPTVNVLRFAVVAGLAWLGLAISAHAQAQCGTHIRMGTLAMRDSSPHRNLLAMRDRWRASAGADYRLTVYPGTVGSESEMIRKMRVNQLHAAMLTAFGIAEVAPDVKAMQTMPLVFDSLEEAEFIREKLRPEIEKSLAEKGFVALFWGDAGWVRFFSKAPLHFPEDMRRMKVFTSAEDTDQVQIMKEMGFQPVPLEWADALPGLQTGMIDSVPTVPLFALGGQYYTVTKHMLEVNWVPLPGAVLINKSCWESLTPAARDALRQAAKEAGAKITADARAENDNAVKAMREKHGLQVHPLTPQMAQAWAKAIEAAHPKIRGRMVPAATFDRVMAWREEYRRTRASAEGVK